MKINTLLILLTLIAFSCGKESTVISPVREKITESVYASGRILSKNQYQVFSTVNGLIERIYKSEGDAVEIGDTILKIKNISSQLNAANAKIAATLANINANGEKIAELKSLSELALLKYKSDSLNFNRQLNLWKQQVGTKVELEQKELLFNNSRSNYFNSLLKYQDLKKQMDFAAQQAMNNLEISNSLEGDFIIKSAVKGKIYSLLKEKGELATAQSAIAIIGDDSNFEIELLVDEYDITKIKTDQLVILSMDSYKGEVFEAKVTKIDPIMNEKTRTFKVTADFIKSPPVIYPHLTVEANILIQEKSDALTIPRTYLMNDTMVMLENGEPRKVSTGLMDYKKVEILKGLELEEKIRIPE